MAEGRPAVAPSASSCEEADASTSERGRGPTARHDFDNETSHGLKMKGLKKTKKKKEYCSNATGSQQPSPALLGGNDGWLDHEHSDSLASDGESDS